MDEIHYNTLDSTIQVVCSAAKKEEASIIHYLPLIHSVFMQMHVCDTHGLHVPLHTILFSCVCFKNGHDFGQKK